MLKGLREDEHSKIIMEKTLADAKKGWMSTPVLLSEDDIDRFVLSPRFCIAQGRASRRGQPRVRQVFVSLVRCGRDRAAEVPRGP
jgi:hypothetical protein